MSSGQSTIPFKSCKLRYKRKQILKDVKHGYEKDSLEVKKRGKFKRLYNSEEESDEETVSPSKISRSVRSNESQALTQLTSSSTIRNMLPCREKETEWLENFLDTHLKEQGSDSLYISGQPGTGKTACLTYILEKPQFKNGYRQIYINCTLMKSASNIYYQICKELQLKTLNGTEISCHNAIEKYLNEKHKMTLIVLDEIDQLDSKRQSVLYTIFDWPAIKDSRLVLIGVANALDLTERMLPRLQARCSLRPHTFHFQPYTKQQIIDIFTSKLSEEGGNSVFSPVAVQMLAAKIAAISGDMRRALDIGKRVIELAKRQEYLGNKISNGDIKKSTTVEIKQVLEVLNEVYGGSKKVETDVDEIFPMQQKLLLCSLILMLTKTKTKDIVIGKLYEVYKRVASSRNIAPMDSAEFGSACELVEARGAIRLSGRSASKAGARTRRVFLQWDEAELSASMQDKVLLASILADVNCLPH